MHNKTLLGNYRHFLLLIIAALLLIITVSWIYRTSYCSCQERIPVKRDKITLSDHLTEPVKSENKQKKHNLHRNLITNNQKIKLIIHRKESLPCGDLYTLFRDINFDHPTVKRSVCKNSIAYSLKHLVYPPCQLSDEFQFDKKHKFTKTKLLIQGKSTSITIFTYSKRDIYISSSIISGGGFEGGQVKIFFDLVKKYSDISLLDIGSNVGIYTLHAAFHKIPVVALDANLRNLVRLRRSAKVNDYSVTLLWNFIGDSPGIEYLNFYSDCNVGGAHNYKKVEFITDIKDTIPVMKITSDQLKPFIKTTKLALKLDIQGGETNFFRHASSLFEEFDIPIVKMELLYRERFVSKKNGMFLLEFFSRRGYRPFDANNKRPLSPKTWKSWYDVLWIKRH